MAKIVNKFVIERCVMKRSKTKGTIANKVLVQIDRQKSNELNAKKKLNYLFSGGNVRYSISRDRIAISRLK